MSKTAGVVVPLATLLFRSAVILKRLWIVCLVFCLDDVYADNVTCPSIDFAQFPILGTDGLKRIDAESVATLGKITASDPLWPYANYLRAEIANAKQESATAFSLWQELVSDPPNRSDSKHAPSALSAASYWRLLQTLETDGELENATIVGIIERAEIALNSRFARGLAGRGRLDLDLLPTLPQVEEASWRLLARIAWRSGLKDEARRFFIEYLKLSAADEFSGMDKEMMDSLVQSGLFSSERFLLFKTKSLIALKSFAKAREYAERTYGIASDPNIKAEAGLLLARHSRFEKPNREIIEILNDVIEYAADSRLQFKALSLRATYHARAARASSTAAAESMRSFVEDLELIIAIAPEESPYTVEALYRLGNHYLDADIGKGLEYYRRLQLVESQHNRMDSAYYIPAMALIRRNAGGDAKRAAKMLHRLTELRPDGPYTLGAYFWIARLQEQSGELDAAQAGFGQLAASDPYHYFGLRARMHLAYGPNAAHMLMPEAALLKQFADTRRQSAADDDEILSDGRYSGRVLAASRCGLYENVLALDERLAHIWPDRRIETLTLEELDRAGMTPALILLSSLRLDTIAAAESADDLQIPLALAALVGKLNDWPLQLRLTADAYANSENGLSDRANAYFANAYPDAYLSQIASSGAANSAPPELLYAIIRNESRFYRSALSVNEAIGLIQMQLKTFRNLQEKPKSDGRDCGLGDLPRTRQLAYKTLMDTDKAIALGGCWIQKELLQAMGGNVVHAIMTHNAGANIARGWIASWEERVISDIELSIELIRYAQTRKFTRRTLTDYTLMKAFGTFDNGP